MTNPSLWLAAAGVFALAGLLALPFNLGAELALFLAANAALVGAAAAALINLWRKPKTRKPL